jgi:hypothetical protein
MDDTSVIMRCEAMVMPSLNWNGIFHRARRSVTSVSAGKRKAALLTIIATRCSSCLLDRQHG